jgi:hypothetical protein
MSSFEDVPQNVCQVVTSAGAVRGTAFFVLPDGYGLTCHHVVFGLPEIWVRFPDGSTRQAEYDSNHSNPEGDIAVLRVRGAAPPGLQLGRCRPAQLVYGYGFRPGMIGQEPAGHAFSGRLSPGQALHVRTSDTDLARLRELGDSAKQLPWNRMPDEYRCPVFNFDLAHGLQPGISGGPVYDPELRRVTGMFRAREGEGLGYVLPLNSVFDRNWPELQKDNEERVRDSALDELATLGIGLVESGPFPPTVPLVKQHIEPVFRDYTLFGGRMRELQALIEFARSENGGYFFVTGPPLGYGKTALLVALARELAADKPSPVVHFLNRNYGSWLDVQSCLENLCLQLMKIHGLGGRVPDREHSLRILYAELLKLVPPPAHRVTVILDGLDETIGLWDIDASLFPPDLPPNVKVIFSAQDIADRAWLDYLKLQLPTTRIQRIERLTASDVSDILLRSGIGTSDTAAVSDRLFKLSGGDAFYLIELLKDLTEAGGDATRLVERSSSSYLRTWWDQVGKGVGLDAFYDLMGTLAVAVAPLNANELVSISEHDALKGRDIGRVLEGTSRYISGNHDDGYQLKHARVRKFVVDTMRDEIANYENSLADFCLGWRDSRQNESKAPYALEHGVRQLIEMKRTPRIDELLSPDFVAAKWRHLSSFGGYIKDLSLAATVMYRENRMEAPRALGLLVARETVRDTISEFPDQVFAAWIRLGDIQRALTTAEDLSEAHGRASGPLLTMAEELLRQAHQGRTASANTYPEIAVSLLERVLGLIPMIRHPTMRYESLEKLVHLVATSAVVSSEQKLHLAQRVIKWGESMFEPIEMAFVLGLGSYLSASSENRRVAQDAFELAEQAAAKIPLASDRLMLFSCRMAAILQLFPAELEARFPGFDAITDREVSFPLWNGSTCHVVASRLGDIGSAARPLLKELARQVTRDIANRAGDARYVLDALLRVGAFDEGVALIDAAYDRSSHALEVTLEDIGRHSEFLRNQNDHAWWPEARRRATPATLAALGEWQAALDRLRAIDPYELDRALLAFIRAIDTKLQMAMPPEVWDALASLIMKVTDNGRAECLAVAALAASHNTEKARGFLESAIQLVITHSTRGGIEKLQSLYAVALHQDNRQEEAAQAALGIEDLNIAFRTLVALTEYSQTDAVATDLYVQALLKCLTRAEERRTADALDEITATSLGFVRAHPDLGKAIYDRIASRQTLTERDAIDLAVTECVFDLSAGWKRCSAQLERIAKAQLGEQPDLLAAMLTKLARVPSVPEAATDLVRSVDDLVGRSNIADSTKLCLETAKASLLARHAPDEAIGLLRRALEALLKPRRKSPAELAAIRFVVMFRLTMHEPAGNKLDEAADAVRIWDAALLALDKRPEGTLNVLRGVLDALRQLASAADETKALTSIFTSVAKLNSAQQAAIGTCLDRAIEQASTIPRTDYKTMALHSAVRALVTAGDIARAERTAALIQSKEPFENLNAIVDVASHRTSPLSAVERHLMSLRPADNSALFTAYYVPDETDRRSFVDSIMETFLVENEKTPFLKVFSREALLNVALSYACVLYRIGGASMIAAIANTIQDYDARFQKAGTIIASTPPMMQPRL